MIKRKDSLAFDPHRTKDIPIEQPAMTSQLIFDFADLPQNSIRRQTTAVEQLCILCGLGRRPSRRVSKATFAVLSNHSLEDFVENSIYLEHANGIWALVFRFATRPLAIEMNGNQDRATTSLRRLGEKLEGFDIGGSPAEGFDISFQQSLATDFVPPNKRDLKQWRQVFIEGDWEAAFGRLSRLYLSGRAKNQQLRDGISIKKTILESGSGNADVILSLVASKTDNAVMIFDTGSNLEWVNQAFSRQMGVKLPGNGKLNVRDVLFSTSNLDAEKFSVQLAAETSFDCCFVILGEDGEPHDLDNAGAWFEFQMTPVRDEDDRVVRWIGIGTDITMRRQAEFAMQAAKDVAESGSRAKSEFLAMMSHEIRTPMNAILGMTELTLGTNLNVEQREYLTTANNSAQSLLQILNDILDLSKVEARRLELERTDFNLADLVRETCDALAVLAQKKGLQLHCNVPWEIPQQLVADMTRIRQILVNLIGNAIKFTSEGAVELNLELTDEINDRATIHFKVRDTGVGIAEEKISRIFEAFYQTDASVNRQYGGTGLGLSITSELVRLMGGRIWVESKIGKGSTFHFVLTFSKSTETQLAASIPALVGKQALLFSENELVHARLNHWLAEWEVQIRSSFSPSETLQYDKYDIVLIDVDSLDEEAYRLAQTLTEENGPPQVLIFSPGVRMAAINQCRQLGIEDYLVTPVSPRYLATVLQCAIGRPVTELTADELQLAGQTAKPTNNRRSTEPATEPVSVLVVDDHAANRMLIAEVLRKRGHQWTEATSGEEAVQLVQQHDFDVVLMDVEMPDKDGLKTTAELRVLKGDVASIPIIAVTAYVTDEDRQRCLEASMDDFLAKPINVAELLEKVERWGRTDRSVQEAKSESETLDTQLLIQDTPDWATHITQTIVDADNGLESESPTDYFDDDVGDESEQFAIALERFGGDQELLRMQMDFFTQGTPQLLENICKAIRSGDARALHHNAHRLKGLVRTFDAEFAGELCAQLEEMGQSDSLEKANPTFQLLESVVEELQHKIATYSS